MRAACRQSRGGFTLMELTLGLVVTSLTVGAVATLLSTVSASWQATEESTSRQTLARQGSRGVQELIWRTRYIGWGGQRTNGSGAAVFLWKAAEEPDETMELGEIVLLEYDSAAQVIRTYQVPATAGNAGAEFDHEDIDSEGDIATFKAIPNMVATTILRDVTRAAFFPRDVAHPVKRQSLEYLIEVERDGRKAVEYRTAAVRAPSPQPG